MQGSGAEDAATVLRDLVRRGASGELVAAGESLEVHVHLHRGRVAWATSSASRGMLVTHLLEHCDVDRDALREVVQECRKSRRRFGETLVEWGVASVASVRAALASQVRDALGSMRRGEPLRALFLPRETPYSEELTFELGEVWGEVEPEAHAEDEAVEGAVQRIVGAIPETRWILVMTSSAIRLAHGRPRGGEAHAFLRSTSRALSGAGAHSATLRCGHGMMLGRAMGAARSWVWCGLPAEANLGLAKAVLATIAPGGSVRPPPPVETEWTTHPSNGKGHALGVLGQALDRSEELVTAAVLDPQTVSFVAGHRRGIDAETLLHRSSQLVDLMRSSLASFFAPTEEPLRLPHTSLHMEDAHFAHFGTCLRDDGGPCLWLVLQRSSTAGLGWALLTSLARQLADDVSVT
jgi:hypothetical protein